MAHFLHYWTPTRAAIAFDNTFEPVLRLENGWFKLLRAGDTLWILTLVEDKPVLVMRGDVASDPKLIRTHPPYAIGNSRSFGNSAVRFDPKTAARPRAVPIPWRQLYRLRFQGRSDRLDGDWGYVFAGPLASLRKLQEGSEDVLEKAWAQHEGIDWISISISKGSQPVFVSAEHRTLVERKAVAEVEADFVDRGWIVSSKEADRVGYDLLCTKRRETLHVEVKGTAGAEPLFFMTRNELKRLESDGSFRLAVVTQVLAAPKIFMYTASAFKKRFSATPMAYSVAPKA